MLLLLDFLRRLFCDRAELVLENAALRQQLLVYKRTSPRPRLLKRDRLFLLTLRRIWRRWRKALVVVQSDTVVRWHRRGWRLFWTWKPARRGRPRIDGEVRALIRRMSRENPTWGAPRIEAELRLLGFEVAESTVARYMDRRPGDSPSQAWAAFLRNHLGEIAACDFFVVPTLTFRLLFCFVVLSHDRRRIERIAVTTNPTADWTAGQIELAFPDPDDRPRYLLRDNDSIYGDDFGERVRRLGIDELRTSLHSPWQNPFVERVIGTLRRECTRFLVPFGSGHLERVLRKYAEYYNAVRPHQSLERNAPEPRWVEGADGGDVWGLPVLGGLHHRYTRIA